MIGIKGEYWRRFDNDEYPEGGDTILVYSEKTQNVVACVYGEDGDGCSYLLPCHFDNTIASQYFVVEKDMWWMPCPILPVPEVEHVAD
jgi:hypothetical protein